MESITLEASNVTIGTWFRVTFEGERAEENAIAYISERSQTHAINEPYNADVDMIEYIDGDHYPMLYDLLYPVCEHGMSAHLCYGEDHYGSEYIGQSLC